MKKYLYYLYDIENNEPLYQYYHTQDEAKAYLKKLVQADDIDQYLKSSDCTFKIVKTDHQAW